MPLGLVRKGSEWGYVRCTGVEIVDRETELPGGLIEIREGVRRYNLQCGCGVEFGIWEDEFEGKRALRDCGCGMAEDDGAGVQVGAFIPARLVAELRRRRKQSGVSVNRHIVRAVKQYVEGLENKQKGANNAKSKKSNRKAK